MAKPQKQFREGKWRYVLEDGSLGLTCPPPTDEERRAMEDEKERYAKCSIAGFHGRWADASQTQCSQCGWIDDERVRRLGEGPIAAVPAPAPPPPGTKLYKVLTQRDEFFGGQFDPMKLEQLINMHAREGWRVVSIATADVSTFFGSFWAGRGARQEIIVFLEKTVS